MRKVILSLFLLSMGFTLFGQGADASVRSLMAAVSKNYKSRPNIKVQFLVNGKTAAGQQAYRSEGLLWIEPKTSRYKMDVDDRELISDGKVLYTVLRAEQEIQLSDARDAQQGLNPANLFTFYDQGYRYARTKTDRQGPNALEVIDFVPTQNSQSVAKIRLRINPKTNLIHDGTLFDRNGGQYTYTIQSFSSQAKAPENTYSVNGSAYANFEKVDLR